MPGFDGGFSGYAAAFDGTPLGGSGGGGGAASVEDGVWEFGCHYEGSDFGRAMEPNAGPISGGPIIIPGFAALAVIRAPYELTIEQMIIASNAGDNTTGFGIFFGTGSGTQQGSDYLYLGGNTYLDDDAVGLVVPAGTVVGLRWTAGTLPQFTSAQLYWKPGDTT